MNSIQRTKRERQEQDLMAAYRKIYSDDDREFFINFALKRAESQFAPKPERRLVASGGI